MSKRWSVTRISAVGATAAVILAVRMALRIAAGPLVRWVCSSGAATDDSIRSIGTNASQLTAIVDRAGGYLSATCLERAIALVLLLRLLHPFRSDAKVQIGARTDSGFRAHAWVEAHGCILLGGSEADYPLLAPPRTRPAPEA